MLSGRRLEYFCSGFLDRLHVRLHPEAGVQVRVRGERGDEGLRHVHPLKVACEELDSKGTGRKIIFFYPKGRNDGDLKVLVQIVKCMRSKQGGPQEKWDWPLVE